MISTVTFDLLLPPALPLSVTNALRASFEGERGALRQLLQQSSLRLETMARQARAHARLSM